MKYTVRCGDKRNKIEIDRSQDLSRPIAVDIGKKAYTLRVHEKTPNGEIQSVSVNNKLLSVQIRRRSDGFPYKVIINGKAYPVEIERVESTRYKPPVPERKVDGTIHASLPGLIGRFLVNPGEKVEKGQPVVILEAMKMENEIPSPIDGVVQTVHVAPGQLVTKGELLVTVE